MKGLDLLNQLSQLSSAQLDLPVFFNDGDNFSHDVVSMSIDEYGVQLSHDHPTIAAALAVAVPDGDWSDEATYIRIGEDILYCTCGHTVFEQSMAAGAASLYRCTSCKKHWRADS